MQVFDWPNDAGGTVVITFAEAAWEADGLLMSSGEKVAAPYYVFEWSESKAGPWNEGARLPVKTSYTGDDQGAFGFLPEGYKTTHYAQVNTVAEGEQIPDGTPIYIRVGIAAGEKMAPGFYYGEIASGASANNWFNMGRMYNFAIIVVLSALVLFFISKARRGIHIYIRRIAGLEAIDEAIGRATEMGRSMYYLCGLGTMADVSTIAATNILGRVALKVAEYESDLKVPCYDAIVMSVCQEVVKQAYTQAGRPDSYKEDNVFFLTQEQFSYVGSINGLMMREKPAANFYFGYYYAESLLLAEAGNQVGAIQIAGTDALVQIPFFISACDYTLIGEELYAASAYISREPKLLGSIKAIDMAKAALIVLIFLGTLFSTIYAFSGDDRWTILKYIFAEI